MMMILRRRTRRWVPCLAMWFAVCVVMTGPVPAFGGTSPEPGESLLDGILLCQNDPLYPTYNQKFFQEMDKRTFQPKRIEPVPYDFVASCATLGVVLGAGAGFLYPWSPTPRDSEPLLLFMGCAAAGMFVGLTAGLLVQKNEPYRIKRQEKMEQSRSGPERDAPLTTIR